MVVDEMGMYLDLLRGLVAVSAIVAKKLSKGLAVGGIRFVFVGTGLGLMESKEEEDDDDEGVA